MVRLTRLRIDRFRNVKPGTDLRFGPTFNVLLGKNATGKTTLLDLIAAITNDDLSAYAKEDAGFDLTWWLEDSETQLEVRAVRTPAKMPSLPERLREEREFDDVWTIQVRSAGMDAGRLNITGTRGVWMLAEQADVMFDVRAGLSASRPCQRALIGLLNKQVERSAFNALHVLTSWGAVDRFDEAIGGIQAITRSQFEMNRQGGVSSGLASAWLPSDFGVPVDAPTSGSLTFSFERVRSLASIPALLGFASAELRPRLLTRAKEGEEVLTTYQGIDCLFRRADGSQISHELLSFGQKRLFSFLWYLAVREELPVVADELLNGLHHDWIDVCFGRLFDRQSFLATQHPLLLDHIPIESVDSVRTTFVRCTLEQASNGREMLVWRNFTEEESERFFIAYQTGIQQVSEVLRTEGLW